MYKAHILNDIAKLTPNLRTCNWANSQYPISQKLAKLTLARVFNISLKYLPNLHASCQCLSLTQLCKIFFISGISSELNFEVKEVIMFSSSGIQRNSLLSSKVVFWLTLQRVGFVLLQNVMMKWDDKMYF